MTSIETAAPSAKRRPPILAAAFAYLIFSWCFVAFAAFVDPHIPYDSFLQSSTVTMLIYIVIVLLPPLAIMLFTKSAKGAFKKLKLETALLVVAAVIFAYIPVVVVNMGWLGFLSVAGLELPMEMDSGFLPSGFMEYVVYFITLTVFPSICEELLFRGMLQRSLAKRGFMFAAVVASLLFALAHMTLQQIVPTFMLGMIIACIMHKTQSVVPGMLYHFVHNGIAALLTILLLILSEQIPNIIEQFPIPDMAIAALGAPLPEGFDAVGVSSPEMGVFLIIYSILLSFPATLSALGAIWMLSLLKYTAPKPDPQPKEPVGALPLIIIFLGALAPIAAIVYRIVIEVSA